MNEIDVSIKWPFKWVLVGSSGSGKTNFALKIIENHQRLFDQTPTRVIVIYKVFQNVYNLFNNILPTSLYKEDDVEIEELTEGNRERLLFVCDDLYFSSKLNEIAEQFLIKGRHQNTSWIVLTQSIFNQPALKNISRNSTHLTLFKNVRLSEPHTLFSQLRPKNSKVLQEIYSTATKKPFGYLDIDMSQTCPDNMRYKTDIFDPIVIVFCIMNNNSFKTMYLVDKKDIPPPNVPQNAPPVPSNISDEKERTENVHPEPNSDNKHTQDLASVKRSSNAPNLQEGLKTDDQNATHPKAKYDKKLKNNQSRIKFQRNANVLGDRWLSGSKTKLNNIRKNDILKSLIKPSDFDFLKSNSTPGHITKWNMLKKTPKKKFPRTNFKQW